jgi:hypothetical protein
MQKSPHRTLDHHLTILLIKSISKQLSTFTTTSHPEDESAGPIPDLGQNPPAFYNKPQSHPGTAVAISLGYYR